MSGKTHGGKRNGAGRKAPLAGFKRDGLYVNARLDIGSWCEAEWQRASQKDADARHDAEAILPARLEEKRVALRERARITGKRVPPSEYQKAGKLVFGKRSRLYKLKLRRPYRLKSKILKGAVAYAQTKFGGRVSERWVQRVWDEFRALKL